ncbi:formate/nitrite transporter family protein [Tetragenococcus halophilus]|uniref:Formate-nitrite transporter n=3 Tax=Tetragenococcus halophilus TaxID=51669 RepID=A0AB35HNE3_TETHA|nr:formate/nitrite transporter family protein [Tetragenococcus halophilus]MCF1601009.1 formate/nitrite transporter family protein [Tetragenococcus halophilus]MCF1675148.1 formate/nitrite transporter family protein [Tetragenococcus halophilus]MCO7026107.1 formate/nitrite transporter family protein [Tetragenococcus halophilus]MCO8283788.1 formate/nitrite transporter family protein [Tetragenococcus halophilus]MCO8286323.1 formate/nitrite transporter family protein [Tetragenococcus halophilus]
MNPVSALFEKIDSSIIKKVDLIESSYIRYALRAILACLFLTLGTAVAFGTAMQAEEVAAGSGKFIYAFMFSWSLVMILYMNAELGTSNMLYMTVGVYRKKINLKIATKILFTCILFNLIGGILFGYLISLTGTFQDLSADNYMFTSLIAKLEKSTVQILVEGIFANIVVNTAVLVSLRMKDDAGKVLAIIFIIFIFAFLGYEHVIANFPAFSLGYFASNGAMGTMTVTNLVHNIVFALLGNYIGGGLVIGLVYAWLNNTKSDYVD